MSGSLILFVSQTWIAAAAVQVVCDVARYQYQDSEGMPPRGHRLAGLVVKASASRAEDPGFESRLRRDFSGSSYSSDLKIGTLVAILPGAWRYRVSWDWLAGCQYTVTWRGRKFDLHLLSVWQQVKLSKQIRPEIH